MQLSSPPFFITAAVAAGGGSSLGWCRSPHRLRARPGTAAARNSVNLGRRSSRTTRTIIRIARSEMGQGTLTGLAQLVADELDVRLEQGQSRISSTPEDNLANKRAWGDMSTGGSRGIRASVDYVRKGGAAGRASC
jgi:isoquinoline 1-oxidoreductase beta subunit